MSVCVCAVSSIKSKPEGILLSTTPILLILCLSPTHFSPFTAFFCVTVCCFCSFPFRYYFFLLPLSLTLSLVLFLFILSFIRNITSEQATSMSLCVIHRSSVAVVVFPFSLWMLFSTCTICSGSRIFLANACRIEHFLICVLSMECQHSLLFLHVMNSTSTSSSSFSVQLLQFLLTHIRSAIRRCDPTFQFGSATNERMEESVDSGTQKSINGQHTYVYRCKYVSGVRRVSYK